MYKCGDLGFEESLCMYVCMYVARWGCYARPSSRMASYQHFWFESRWITTYVNSHISWQVCNALSEFAHVQLKIYDCFLRAKQFSVFNPQMSTRLTCCFAHGFAFPIEPSDFVEIEEPLALMARTESGGIRIIFGLNFWIRIEEFLCRDALLNGF